MKTLGVIMKLQKSIFMMNFRHAIFFQCLFVLPLISFPAVSAAPHRLSATGGTILRRREAKITSQSASEDVKTYFYTQTLDHFNYRPESYATFKQRYMVNRKYWGGAKVSAPIFAYLGAEAPIDSDVLSIGFLPDNAPRFKALIIYIEHRYYGRSIPFGLSLGEALQNETTRGYFNSAQAIADYAEVLIYLRKKLSAQNSPIIVLGGSYGGMLASWFRLKYPHIALGALASSAPILYFDNITPENGYYSIVTKDFREASESCYEAIRRSWYEIDEMASKPNGLSILSRRFKTCRHLNNSSELKNYLDSIFCKAAQYNSPPTYPVNIVCGGINGAAAKGADILGRIFAGLAAFVGIQSCYDVNEYSYPTQSNLGWQWQMCTEMMMPIGHDRSNSMFQSAPFSFKNTIRDCMSMYGVKPRPHWVTTYYGGHDIKLILQRFASNIIFSNGLRDPYSSGGVLEDISDSVLALHTTNGSHCLDIVGGRHDDPEWLVMQRNSEVKIIEGWITKYYADLHALKG